MTSAFRFVSDRALVRLEVGLIDILHGDRSQSHALRRDAREVLTQAQPMQQFIRQHGFVLGALSLAVLLGTLVSGFNLFIALGDASLARAFASGMSTAAGATFLILAHAVTRRAGTATALAVRVLAQLDR